MKILVTWNSLAVYALIVLLCSLSIGFAKAQWVDNLIAKGKAKPMMVDIANGIVSTGRGGHSSEGMADLEKIAT